MNKPHFVPCLLSKQQGYEQGRVMIKSGLKMSHKQCKGLIAITAGNLHNGTICAIRATLAFCNNAYMCISESTTKKISGIFPVRGCSCLHCVALLCAVHLKTIADNLYLMGQVQLSSIVIKFHFQHLLLIRSLQIALQCPPDLLYLIWQALFFPLTDSMFIFCIVA